MQHRSPNSYNLDADGYVINGPGTYHFLGRMMEKGMYAFFPWTDGAGTQYDIFMTPLETFGEFPNIQGGLARGGFLYVGLMQRGSFAFNVDNGEKSPSYVGEKLLTTPGTYPTSVALATLINAVIGDFMGV